MEKKSDFHHHLNTELTSRDFELFKGLYYFTVLSYSQINAWYFENVSLPTTSNRLTKLKKSGYLRRLQIGIIIHHGHEKQVGSIFGLTKKAHQILQTKYPKEKFREEPVPFNTQSIHHDLCLNELIRSVKMRNPNAKVSHGKLIRCEFDRSERLPDAVIEFANDSKKTAIELELTAKSETRYRSIITSYRLSRHFGKILYITGNESIKSKIEFAITGYRPRINLPPQSTSPFELSPLKEWI